MAAPHSNKTSSKTTTSSSTSPSRTTFQRPPRPCTSKKVDKTIDIDTEITKLKKEIEFQQLKKKLSAITSKPSRSDQLRQKIEYEKLKKTHQNMSNPPKNQRQLEIDKLTEEKEMELLKQDIQKIQKSSYVPLMSSQLQFKVNNDPNHNLRAVDISYPSNIKYPLSGGGGNNGAKLVLIDDLTDDQKTNIFKGARRLLYGRKFDRKTRKISTCYKALFKLKSNNGSNLEDAIVPALRKILEIHESYNAIQKSLTESSYFDMETQAAVAGYGALSFGTSNFKENQSINTQTGFYLTAASLITKGIIVIDEDIVQYTDRFKEELQLLLDNNIREENEWIKFTNKFGQYYISAVEIGGAAYCSREETSIDTQNRKSSKQEFRTSFEKTIGMGSDDGAGSIGIQTNSGSSNDDTKKSVNKSSNLSLSCHGGNAAICSPDDFREWEVSINTDYRLWDIIKILQVKPFYNLLDKQTQTLILNLIPSLKLPEPEMVEEEIKRDQVEIKNRKVLTAYQSDDGSGASMHCFFYRAKEVKLVPNEFEVGVVCKGSEEDTEVITIIGTENIDVKKPVRCEKIWDDSGSNNSKQYQIWRPIAPKGFVSLSDIPNFGTKLSNKTTNWGTDQGFWCVSEDLIEKTEIDGQIWNDSGTWSSKDGSIWKVVGTNFMIGNNGKGKPDRTCYTLKDL